MFEYQGFATLGVNLNRQKYGPLDISNVFTSLADLNYYLSKGANKEGVSDYWKNTVPYPYAGQYVALVDNTTRTVTPYMLSEKADGTFETIKVGAPEVDGETIIINENGKLEAVIPEIEIPEYIDTNTTYKLSVTATTEEDSEEGVKITLTPYDGEVAGTPQSFIIADPDLSDYITSSELETALATKADLTETANRFDELEDKVSQKVDRVDVYTITETDQKIGEAIAAADHLKRKIVDSKEDIDVNAADALQYIYMVPIGPTDDDNKYREYIVLENADGSRYIEQVGNWEVNLSGYLTEADAANTYATADRVNELEEKVSAKVDRADVYIIGEADEKFATKNEVTETLQDYVTEDELSNYATKDEIPVLPDFEDYVTEEEFTERIANYETIEEAEGKYVAQEEGKSLISTEEIERLAKVDENAEVNFIKAVNTQALSVNEQGQLDIKQVKQELISDLVQTTWNVETSTDGEGNEINNFVATTKPAKLSEILVPASYDADSKTGVSGLMTAEQVQKLQALVIGDEGIEISGTVNADNVTGLGAWITTNRNKVEGLYPTADSELLSTLNTLVTNETDGLNKRVNDHSSRLDALEDALTWREMN